MKNFVRKLTALVLAFALMSTDLAAVAAVLKTLQLPEGLKTIETEAFYGAASLEKVVVPEGTLEIQSRAFSDSSLMEIELPESLEYIAPDAFEDVNPVFVVHEDSYAHEWVEENGGRWMTYGETYEGDFAYVTLADGTAEIALYWGEGTEVTVPSEIAGLQVTSIGERAFAGYPVTSVTIPEGVTSIGVSAFLHCEVLETTELPESLELIDEFAFQACYKLNNVVVPENVDTIAPYAFSWCYELENIKLPQAMDFIGENVFWDARALNNVTIPNGLTSIEEAMFADCISLTSITVPEGVTTLGLGAFIRCTGLERIALPESLETIDERAFEECTALVSIEIPENVTSIADDAFGGCNDPLFYVYEGSYAEEWCSTNLYSYRYVNENADDFGYVLLDDGTAAITSYSGTETSVVIPTVLDGYTITEIGESAFEGKETLLGITVPKGILSINSRAFADSGLEAILLSTSLTFIADDIFEGCGELQIFVYDGSYAEEWCAANGYDASVMSGDSSDTGDEEDHTGMPELDVSSASLDRYTYYPGDTIVVSGIKVKNADYIYFYGTDGCLNYDTGNVWLDYSSERQTIEDIHFVVPDDAVNGDYFLRMAIANDTTNQYVHWIDIEEFDGFKYTIAGGVSTVPELDVSEVQLNKSVYAPGETIYITGIKYKNSNWVDCSTIFGGSAIGPTKTDSFTTWDTSTDVGEYAANGIYELVITAFDYQHNDNDFFWDNDTENWVKDSYTLYFTVENGETSTTNPTVSNYRINDTATELTVEEGDTLTFDGVINAPDGGTLTAALVSVFTDGTNYEVGEEYHHVTGLTDSTYDLSSTPVMTVGEAFGDSNYTMTAGNSYVVMLYTTDSNGNGFVDHNASEDGHQGPSILVHVVEGAKKASEVWEVNYDQFYTTITVTAKDGAEISGKDYLFVAENANGGHHSGVIPAGKNTASFGIKELEMPRAAKYMLFVLQADEMLTDKNRDQYCLGDLVLPLYGGNMITAVRSGGMDVTADKKLYIGDTIEIDWQGSYGVYNVEVAATLNGQMIKGFPKPYDDPALIDRDKAVTTAIASSELGNVKAGDELTITVTVTPTAEAQAVLTAADKKSMESKSWTGTFEERYVSIVVENADGSTTVYDKDNPIHLYVGDHNDQKGWKLSGTVNEATLATCQIYSDNPGSVFPYRIDGEVFIEAKKDQDANIYISPVQAATLEDVPEEYRYFVCKVDMPIYRALLMGVTQSYDQRDYHTANVNGMREMLNLQNSTNYNVTLMTNATTTLSPDDVVNNISECFEDATEHDVSLFYFSGHGAEGGELVCANNQNLEVEQLVDALDDINGRKIILLQSCHSGVYVNNETLQTDQTFILTACAGDEVASAGWSESGALAGWFTACLALSGGYDMNTLNQTETNEADTNGDGRISFVEVYNLTYETILAMSEALHATGAVVDGAEVSVQHVQRWSENEAFVLWAR